MISEMPNIDGLRPAVLAVLAAKREPVRLLDYWPWSPTM